MVSGPSSIDPGTTSQSSFTKKTSLSKELGRRLLGHLEEKQKRIPLRNKIYLERSTRCVMRGRKKKISKQLFDQALDYEFNMLRQKMGIRWGEKRALKRFIENTMFKMYDVC